MKNILIIQSGGRPNGNTAQLINSFIAGAKECGHSIELISLIKNEVKGCLGCNACRYGKPCIQKDSFNNLIPRIKDADCIVFASPLYFWTISSRIKAFIERFYCIAEEDPNPDKPEKILQFLHISSTIKKNVGGCVHVTYG